MMKVVNTKKSTGQRGAVSLFVVIFTALLVTTITISFVQLMVRDQRQAMYGDLSESAYDSAVAGVEDAKRALLMQQDCVGSATKDCKDITEAINSGECTTLSKVFGGASAEETMIQQQRSGEDNRLDQAYTCVKITQNTDDYLGTIDPSATATLIPLRGDGDFDTVVVSWGLSKNGADIKLPKVSTAPSLPEKNEADWPNGYRASYPALLRVQLINGGSSFNLSDFDGAKSRTLFLLPSSTHGIAEHSFATDSRRGGNAINNPQIAKCGPAIESGKYVCSAALRVGSVISSGSATAFLNLIALYNASDYKIELRNGGAGGSPVKFVNVQPEVDSTGRANDLFRRVVSRVELNNTFSYPVAAVETAGNLCKNFHITTDEADYKSNCTP